jgi:hypothetical protein
MQEWIGAGSGKPELTVCTSNYPTSYDTKRKATITPKAEREGYVLARTDQEVQP